MVQALSTLKSQTPHNLLRVQPHPNPHTDLTRRIHFLIPSRPSNLWTLSSTFAYNDEGRGRGIEGSLAEPEQVFLFAVTGSRARGGQRGVPESAARALTSVQNLVPGRTVLFRVSRMKVA